MEVEVTLEMKVPAELDAIEEVIDDIGMDGYLQDATVFTATNPQLPAGIAFEIVGVEVGLSKDGRGSRPVRPPFSVRVVVRIHIDRPRNRSVEEVFGYVRKAYGTSRGGFFNAAVIAAYHPKLLDVRQVG